MGKIQKIAPCLWFDSQAENAANFYVSIFDDSRIVRITKYTSAGYEIHGKPAGSVLTVEFELSGQRLTALNGGPQFKFNESISFEVICDTQEEIDYFWEKLSEGGEKGSCGWLKDRYGLSWQITPTILGEMLCDPNEEKRVRVTDTFLKMTKLEIEAIKKAFDGADK
ncbi:MAG: VOC family protein [Anaerolineales bacterium]|jgi:predicted 3-demethylubiquinone-9 3-methyltransferase (glyoxalase superfamily)